jgi:hypothetical protein
VIPDVVSWVTHEEETAQLAVHFTIIAGLLNCEYATHKSPSGACVILIALPSTLAVLMFIPVSGIDQFIDPHPEEDSVPYLNQNP